jgi:hypothetical protein
VPSLIEGLQVVQGLRVVPVFLYQYSMKISLKKARSSGTSEGGRSDWALGAEVWGLEFTFWRSGVKGLG